MNSGPTIVVFISGEGTNLQVLIDAQTQGTLPGTISYVFSNRKDAYGLQRASHASIPSEHLPLKPWLTEGKTREEYDIMIAEKLTKLNPDLVILAGWMHIFSPEFFNHYHGEIINIHPSLPGAYAGPDAIGWALESYKNGLIEHTGVMIHRVTAELDLGPQLNFTPIAITVEDTRETLTQRIHQAEYSLLLTTVSQILS